MNIINKISHIIVSQKLFPEMVRSNNSPMKIANEKGWIQEDNEKLMKTEIEKVMNKYPDKILEYQNGNSNLLGLFMGEIMRETKGKLNPKSISEVLKEALKKR